MTGSHARLDLPDTAGLSLELGIDGVATVTIDRPHKANAIDRVIHTRLTTLWSELASIREVGAIVLTGAGNTFCGGGDRDGWISLIEDRAWRRRKMREARSIVYGMLECEVPIVGAINGPAIGLGSSLALACDAIVMAQDAYLLDPHVSNGLVAGDGGAALLPALLPMAVARQMLFTGARLSAEEAFRYFLVADVLPREQVLRAARALGATLCSQPRDALRDTKRAVNLTLLGNISHALELSSANEEASFDNPDFHVRIGYDGDGLSDG